MRKSKKILSILIIFIMTFASVITVDASWTQTETTRTVEVNGKKNSYLKAYAAFDRFGNHISNGYEWDYTTKATITHAPKAGKLKLTTVGQATMRSSASMSIGIIEVSAGASSSWQTVTEEYSDEKKINKETDEKYSTQSIKSVSNLIIAPSKNYDWNTACITAKAVLTLNGQSEKYRINALA